MKNFSLMLAVFLALCIITSGCGYRIGARSMMHPQFQTIAIADVKNETLEPLAAGQLRKALAEHVQRDGALTLKQPGGADCILHATIIAINSQTIRNESLTGQITYLPGEFRIHMQVEFEVRIPGSATPLVAKRSVREHVDFQQLTDINVARANALKQLCSKMAKTIISYTTEAW